MPRRSLEQNADAEVHKRLGEVDDFFAMIADRQRRHRQIRFLHTSTANIPSAAPPAVHRCGILLHVSHVPWSVCMSVCFPAKRLNRSRCRLGENRVSPRHHVLRHTGATWRIRLNDRACARRCSFISNYSDHLLEHFILATRVQRHRRISVIDHFPSTYTGREPLIISGVGFCWTDAFLAIQLSSANH